MKIEDYNGIVAKYYVPARGKGCETCWKARGQCWEGGGAKDQTPNTVQPIGVRTSCTVALLADHKTFRY
jgi:hypothetical protein